MNKNSYIGYALAFVGAILVGIFPFALQQLVITTGSMTTAAGMLLTSALACAAVFAVYDFNRHGQKPTTKPKSYLYGHLLLMIASGTIGNILATWSLQEVMPATMQFLQRFEIIAMIVLGVIFLQEQLTKRLVISTIFTFLGIYVIYKTNFVYANWYSLLLPIVSGICFAILNLGFKKLASSYSPAMLNFIRLIFTVLIFAFIPQFLQQVFDVGLIAWAWAMLAALIGPVGARTLYIYSFNLIPVSHSILFTAISPVIVLIIQWLWLHNIPDSREIIGGFIIIGAIVYLLFPRKGV